MARLPLYRKLLGPVLAIVTIATLVDGAIARERINSVPELFQALKECLMAQAFKGRSSIAFSARMGFRRNGELLGPPFVFFQSSKLSEKERQAYREVIERAFKGCTPLPFTAQFGSAMAGYPIMIHFIVSDGRTIIL